MPSPSERIKFLNELAHYLEQSECELSEVIDWRENAGKHLSGRDDMVECPLDQSHKIALKNWKSHLQLCQIRKLGVKGYTERNLPSSSNFFYQNSTSVIPIILGSSDLAKIGVLSESMHFPGILVHDSKDLWEKKNTGANEDTYQELKDIFAWQTIPERYNHIDTNVLTLPCVQNWISSHLKSTSWGSKTPDIAPVEEFLLCTLRDPALNTPNGVFQCLREILGEDDTKPFVLELWKVLHSCSIADKCGILEGDVEYLKQIPFTDFGTNEKGKNGNSKDNSQLKSKSPTQSLLSAAKNVPLPMDVAWMQLPSNQKAAVYDFVMEVAKGTKKEKSVTYDDLKSETELQMKATALLEENKGDKKRSHLEIIAELRDFKRRRQSYRAKNTHITRRSATEILKGLIEDQMKYLELMSKQSLSDLLEQDPSTENSLNPPSSETLPATLSKEDGTQISSTEHEDLPKMARDGLEFNGKVDSEQEEGGRMHKVKAELHEGLEGESREQGKARWRDTDYKSRSGARSNERHRDRSRDRDRDRRRDGGRARSHLQGEDRYGDRNRSRSRDRSRSRERRKHRDSGRRRENRADGRKHH